MSRRNKFDADQAKQILSYIRAGGFEHVAAEAAGVMIPIFQDWIRRGELPKAKEPYRSFAIGVKQAKAQARLRAEMEALGEDPRFWLRAGPGKEQPGSPGWTAVVRAALDAKAGQINIFASPEFLKFMELLRAALAPHPEALAAITQALNQTCQAETKPEISTPLISVGST